MSNHSALIKLRVIKDFQIAGTPLFKGRILYMDSAASRAFRSGRDSWRTYNSDGELIAFSLEPYYSLREFVEEIIN